MAYTDIQKAEINKIINDNLKEFVPAHEITHAASLVINSAENDIDKVLGDMNKYFMSISLPTTTIMLTPVFKNKLSIMNNELKTYISK